MKLWGRLCEIWPVVHAGGGLPQSPVCRRHCSLQSLMDTRVTLLNGSQWLCAMARCQPLEMLYEFDWSCIACHAPVLRASTACHGVPMHEVPGGGGRYLCQMEANGGVLWLFVNLFRFSTKLTGRVLHAMPMYCLKVLAWSVASMHEGPGGGGAVTLSNGGQWLCAMALSEALEMPYALIQSCVACHAPVLRASTACHGAWPRVAASSLGL